MVASDVDTSSRSAGSISSSVASSQRWLSFSSRVSALRHPDDGAPPIPRVPAALGRAVPLEPVDERGQRAAREAEVARHLGLAAAAVDLEVGERLALRRAQAGALWEDVKLAPLIAEIRWVALVTDIEWYARSPELAGAVWPGLAIKHFEPADVVSARAWLATRSIG